ncbi:MAG: hypothetical protein Q8P60_05375, partial [Pseudorhodobacter sp.]|nr:hypothetical protein [Pseudorhodobacter sp.]
KGAFWKERPEAKIIYEGGKPPKGFTGYELASFSFLRFIEGEHSAKDGNYIVAPPGAKIYTDSIGQFYSAECGNKIEFIGPVERFILMPMPPKQDSTKAVSSGIVNNITNNTVNNYYTTKDTTVNKPYQFVPDTIQTKWYNTAVARIVEGGLLAFGGYKLYGLLEKKNTALCSTTYSSYRSTC